MIASTITRLRTLIRASKYSEGVGIRVVGVRGGEGESTSGREGVNWSAGRRDVVVMVGVTGTVRVVMMEMVSICEGKAKLQFSATPEWTKTNQ